MEDIVFIVTNQNKPKCLDLNLNGFESFVAPEITTYDIGRVIKDGPYFLFMKTSKFPCIKSSSPLSLPTYRGLSQCLSVKETPPPQVLEH